MNNIIFEKENYRVCYLDGVYKVMMVLKDRTLKLGSCLTEKEAVDFCKNLSKE